MFGPAVCILVKFRSSLESRDRNALGKQKIADAADTPLAFCMFLNVFI